MTVTWDSAALKDLKAKLEAPSHKISDWKRREGCSVSKTGRQARRGGTCLGAFGLHLPTCFSEFGGGDEARREGGGCEGLPFI